MRTLPRKWTGAIQQARDTLSLAWLVNAAPGFLVPQKISADWSSLRHHAPPSRACVSSPQSHQRSHQIGRAKARGANHGAHGTSTRSVETNAGGEGATSHGAVAHRAVGLIAKVLRSQGSAVLSGSIFAEHTFAAACVRSKQNA